MARINIIDFAKRRVVLVLVLHLFFYGCKPKLKKQPDFIFKTALLVNEKHTWYKAFEYFKTTLEKRSSGRIEVQIYPSEQLAKEIEAIRLIQAEVIEMTVTSSSLSNWVEVMAFSEMPFLVQDSTHMKRLLNGKIGKRMENEMLTKTGLRALCYFQRGERHLTSNRPIKHPDDLKGLIVRVPAVKPFITAWSALGAKPTPMAFSEVFTSLQQGTIEGQENPFAMINNAGFSEVQKYVNLTQHVVSWVYAVVGEKQFKKLPNDLRKIFLETAKDMQAYEHKLFLKDQRIVQDLLKNKGMVFIEVDNEAFQEKCEEAIYKSLSPSMQQMYNLIKEEGTNEIL